MKDARKEAKELKREDRSRNPPQRYGQSYSHNSTFFPKEPDTYEKAVKSIDSKKWQDAMKKEPECLHETKTWNLVQRPSQKNVIPGKWVYKVKTKANGSRENITRDTLLKVLNKLKALTMQKRLLQPANQKLFDSFFR